MYNPQNLHECEIEKAKVPEDKKPRTKKIVDSAMTGIGLVASLSSVPQVIKILKTNVVDGISLTTQVIALIAVISWFAYGIYIKNKPLIITSALSSVVLGIVVVQILMHS